MHNLLIFLLKQQVFLILALSCLDLSLNWDNSRFISFKVNIVIWYLYFWWSIVIRGFGCDESLFIWSKGISDIMRFDVGFVLLKMLFNGLVKDYFIFLFKFFEFIFKHDLHVLHLLFENGWDLLHICESIWWLWIEEAFSSVVWDRWVIWNYWVLGVIDASERIGPIWVHSLLCLLFLMWLFLLHF